MSALVCTYVYKGLLWQRTAKKCNLYWLKIVDLEFYAILANFVRERKKSEKSPIVQKLKYLTMKRKNRQPCIFCDFLKGQEKWQILRLRKQKVANFQLRTSVSANWKFQTKNLKFCSCARECNLNDTKPKPQKNAVSNLNSWGKEPETRDLWSYRVPDRLLYWRVTFPKNWSWTWKRRASSSCWVCCSHSPGEKTSRKLDYSRESRSNLFA